MNLDIAVDMHFCRRCGTPLTHKEGVTYACANSHIVFANASPATALILLNDADEILVLERNIEPHKGMADMPGGFCDGAEPSEDAIRRELQEEVKIAPDQYTDLEFVCTAIDPYPFKGEVLPVHVTVFKAYTKGVVAPQLDHENASAKWVPLRTFDIDTIPFPAIRHALRLVQASL